MIFACALAKSLKLAKFEGVQQSSLKEITEKLAEDPDITRMQVVALTDQDVTSIAGKRLCDSLKRKHSKIIVCYMYKAESNADKIGAGDNVFKQRLSKISPETVKRTMSRFLDGVDINTDEVVKLSNDSIPDIDSRDKEKKKSGFFDMFKKSTPSKPKKDSSRNIPNSRTTGNADVLPKVQHKRKRRVQEEEDINELPSELRSKVIGNDTDEDLEVFSSSVSEDEAILIDDTFDDQPVMANQSGRIRSHKSDVNDDEVYIANEEYSDTVSEKQEQEAVVSHAANINSTDLQATINLNGLQMPNPRKADKMYLDKSNLNIPAFEDRMVRMHIEDTYDFIAGSMQKSSITRELLNTDTEFANCTLLLEQWDKEMGSIYTDMEMSPKERWNRIRELAYKRTEKAGVLNSKIANKVGCMISTITSVCERSVTNEIDEIRKGIASVIDAQVVNLREEEVSKLVEERNDIANRLRETLMTIVEIYKLMDVNVEDILEAQADGLPSNNSMITNQLALERDNFIPENSGLLAAKVLEDLKDGLVKFSQMERSLQSLILDVFKLIDKDSTIIKEQEERYRKLKAVRVEETVTITNVLKNVLRVFIGPNEAGTTATALTWAGLRSRRQNTLLIDARPDNMRTTNYGEAPTEAMGYLNSNGRDHFKVLKLNSTTPMDIDELLAILETKTDYFGSINIILDDTQVDIANRCIDKALAVNVITNSTVGNIERTKKVIGELRPENVGLKIVAIDPVVERMEFIQNLSAQDSIFKLVSISYLREIRACGLRREAPYLRETIATVFEEAFR